MSTRLSLRRGRLLSNVALLSLLAAFAAGCSDNASRFVDPLFTASTSNGPVPVDKFGAVSSSGFNAQRHTALPPSEPRPDRVFPQRVDGQGEQRRQTDAFTARNITKLARKQNFRAGDLGYAQRGTSYRSQNVGSSAAVSRLPSLGQPSRQVSQPPSVARQSLPPVQTLPRKTRLTEKPVDLAAINDREEGAVPLLERQPSRPSTFDTRRAPVSQRSPVSQPDTTSRSTPFPSGTEWTQKYSPVPTHTPRNRFRSASTTGTGPRAYTPPSASGRSVDRTTTSSTRGSRLQPKVVRNTLPKDQPGIDPIIVTSVNSSNQGVSDREKGWTKTGGTYVSVNQGETLYSISRRYGVPVNAITRVNNIQNPSEVQAGRKLLIPTYVYSPDAPVSAPDANKKVREARFKPQQTAKPTVQVVRANIGSNPVRQPLPPKIATAQADPSVYTVVAGDTLTRIASKNAVSVSALKRANGIEQANHIVIGQTLRIPKAGQTETTIADVGRQDIDRTTTASINQGAASSVPRDAVASLPKLRPSDTLSVPKSALAATPRTPPSRDQAPKRREIEVARVEDSALPVLDTDDGLQPYTRPNVNENGKRAANLAGGRIPQGPVFQWPVRGEMLAGFGQSANGKANEGIDISVPVGTPVRAAAAGEVIYADNGLTGYGNLVLIRHAKNYVSAYAYNSELLVKPGDRVRQGQAIAKSGRVSAENKPAVHFELRQGKTPVDPLAYLVI